ncbi:MAG TPA: hypothetical protein PLA94_21405, partial [Myxococcota bacterium]|nr:hypothetical protein [Myxococcota bacterium]
MILYLLACAAQSSPEALPDPGQGGGDSAETVAACEVQVESSFPEDGATRLPVDTVLELRLSAPEPDAMLELVGVEGELERLEGGHLLRWTPLAPLAEGSDFLVRAQVCGSGLLTSFSTRYPEVQVDLSDRVYGLDLSKATWEEPAELGSLLSSLMGGPVMLVEVESHQPQELGLEFWTALPGEREVGRHCTQPTTFQGVSFLENPWFSATARDGWLSGVSGPVPLWWPTLSGTFAADGASLVELRVEALIEAKPLSALIGQDL